MSLLYANSLHRALNLGTMAATFDFSLFVCLFVVVVVVVVVVLLLLLLLLFSIGNQGLIIIFKKTPRSYVGV